MPSQTFILGWDLPNFLAISSSGPLMDLEIITLSTGLGGEDGPSPREEQQIPAGSNRAAPLTWSSTDKRSSPEELP